MKSTDEGACGVVAVDKPTGMTSHDVVARARRLLGTRRIGHAGTLDPMATGVLVLLAGEATKLGPYLTAHSKRYEARVAFGIATDTLDREGTATAKADVPAWLRDAIATGATSERLAEAIAGEHTRREQIPPAYSAIQVGGQRSYDRARAGEAVDLAPRPVEVHAIEVRGGGEIDHEGAALVFVDLAIDVSKGYYVRSLARDLGERIGVPAHLAALRRTASGPFTLARASTLEADAMRALLQPLASAAAEAMPSAQLTTEGAVKARQGKRLVDSDFVAPPTSDDVTAWLDPDGRLVAIGARGEASALGGGFVVERGFAT